MPHDWRTALSTPPLFVPGTTWHPYVYHRPDGVPVTVCGSNKAILVVPGNFADLVTDKYESSRVEFGDKSTNKCASGAAIDGIIGTATDPLGTTTVAALRAAAGEQLVPTESDGPCDGCGGRGTIECYACGHEDDCEECDGTGRTVCIDVPDPYYIDFGGRFVDVQLVAPLFARVPDGAVEVRAFDGASRRFHLVGDGWQIVIQSMIASFKPDDAPRQLLLSPNVPVPA
jgi:hypothetical protein